MFVLRHYGNPLERRLLAAGGVASGLRSAELAVGFVVGEVPEYQRRQVVELALNIASPLRNVEKLRLHKVNDYKGQRSGIVQEVEGRIRAGTW